MPTPPMDQTFKTKASGPLTPEEKTWLEDWLADSILPQIRDNVSGDRDADAQILLTIAQKLGMDRAARDAEDDLKDFAEKDAL